MEWGIFKMNLKELLTAVEILNKNEIVDLNISGLAYHSGMVVPGNLFVCIKGYKTDGHQYLSHAVEKGAIAAIVEEVQEDISIPQFIVKNSRVALARLADYFYNHPSRKMTMIGITATNGKTTTTFMTNAILENEGFKTGLIGTVEIKIDDYSIPSVLTTPESLDLQNYLSQMVSRDVSHVSMEVSSNALETHRVETVDYDIVTFNNISREHIDSHGSFEKYYEIKSSLITEANEKTYAVLNLDDPYSASLINKTKAKVITFGVEHKEGHLTCKNLDLSTGRARFTVEILKPIKRFPYEYQPCEFDIELSVPGLHSVYNSMVAITVGLLCGVSIETIQKTMKTFVGVERRFEYIFEDDFKIIDDHFANAGNIHVTLKTLQHMDFKNLHLVYAIRGGRGPTVNRENAEAIAEWALKLGYREIIATKSISHVTSKDFVTEEEVDAFLKVLSEANLKVDLYDELQDAILSAVEKANTGDLIILGGAQGMDYGAGIALEIIRERKPNIPVSKLFSPLQYRVAGVTDEQRELIVQHVLHDKI